LPGKRTGIGIELAIRKLGDPFAYITRDTLQDIIVYGIIIQGYDRVGHIQTFRQQFFSPGQKVTEKPTSAAHGSNYTINFAGFNGQIEIPNGVDIEC
jgi:hypothetical protein